MAAFSEAVEDSVLRQLYDICEVSSRFSAAGAIKQAG